MANFNINITAKVIDSQNILGESANAGDLVYLSNNGKYYKTNASNPLKYKTEVRIVLTTGIQDDIVDMLTYGYYDFGSEILVSGAKYYLSTTSGKITNTQYINTSNGIRYIGTAYNAQILLFNPDQTYINSVDNTVNDIPLASFSSEYSLAIIDDNIVFSKDGNLIFTDDLSRYYDNTNLSRIVSGYYDLNEESETYQNIVLVRSDSTKITINVSDFISLIPTKTSNLINDGENGTDPFITDLSEYTKTEDLGSAAFNSTEDFATAQQGKKADTALQPGDSISTLTDDIGVLTETEAATIYQPVLSTDNAYYIENNILKQNIRPFSQEFIYTETDYPNKVFTIAFNSCADFEVSYGDDTLTELVRDKYEVLNNTQIRIKEPIIENSTIKIKYKYYVNPPL